MTIIIALKAGQQMRFYTLAESVAQVVVVVYFANLHIDLIFFR